MLTGSPFTWTTSLVQVHCSVIFWLKITLRFSKTNPRRGVTNGGPRTSKTYQIQVKRCRQESNVDWQFSGIQELLIRIVLEKPCNVTITELYDVFKELKPKRAQKHFERLWDILHLQDQDIVPGNFKRHKASIMQHEKDVEPAVKAQSFPASFVIPDQSVWLFHPDYLMGLWPLIGYDRQLICPCCYSIALVDPHTFCSPPSTMNGYISHPPDYMSQPLDLRALFWKELWFK
jgi:hypothetical protein